ncbi:pitrilysin family protein [Roseisolibacter sp. H3M3-2]|nr:pitrilysin family protein [Roseisolibacter sp. H3M3-2]
MSPKTTLRAALLLTVALPIAAGAQQAPRVTKDAPATQPPRAAGAAGRVDRSKPPALPPTPALRVPTITTRALSNGITVAVLENHEIPVVSVRALVDAPAVLDPAGKEGTGALAFAMLAEGTTTRTAEQLADAFAELGTAVAPTGFLTVTGNVDRALELMRDQLWNPAFPQAALDRIRANQVANLRRLKDQPTYLAGRVLANALYGAGHPYERATSEASLQAITRDDVAAFHDAYVRPQNVKFVVAGDITPAQAIEKLERVFARWPAGGKKAGYEVPAPPAIARTTIYLHDRPGSAQSVIYAASHGPRRDAPEYYALDLANTVLGGSFLSRLNTNLRETHGYAYGAGSGFSYRRRPEIGQFAASAQVQTDKTDSSVVEIVKELRDIAGARPITQAEYDLAMSNAVKGLPLAFETVSQLSGAATQILTDSLPLDYYANLSRNYEAATVASVNAAAKKYIDPAKLAIVVVGDRKQIEDRLRALNIAPVVVVDEQAKPVAAPTSGGAQR